PGASVRIASKMADRPSFDSKSVMTALTSSLAPASCFEAIKADLLAKASLVRPHKPFGSAAETAMPTSATLSKTFVHSCGVKFSLFAMALFQRPHRSPCRAGFLSGWRAANDPRGTFLRCGSVLPRPPPYLLYTGNLSAELATLRQRFVLSGPIGTALRIA